MDDRELDAWEAQTPSEGFAERVTSAARKQSDSVSVSAAEPSAPDAASRRTARGAVIAVAIAAAAAVVVFVSLGLWPGAEPSGSRTAIARVEESIGDRAVAVMEPGAVIDWQGDRVTQTRGDVFYRVDRGDDFIVVTPAGLVEVLGTSFRVLVRPAVPEDKQKDVLMKRNLKTGAAGLALGALAVVTVYEGKVLASHGDESVQLVAGQSVQLDGDGVDVIDRAALETARNALAGDVERAVDYEKANQALAGDLFSMRRRIESLTAQKEIVAEKLSLAQEQLDKLEGKPEERAHWDHDQEDWVELAREGKVPMQIPCGSEDPPEELVETLKLTPDEIKQTVDIKREIGERLWAVLRPLCANVLGSEDAADVVGRLACSVVVHKNESERDEKATSEAIRQVAEMRAGLREIPEDTTTLHPVTQIFLANTGATRQWMDRLSEALGQERADKLWKDGGGCVSRGVYAVGPRPEAEKE